jgi:hypothetical protein
MRFVVYYQTSQGGHWYYAGRYGTDDAEREAGYLLGHGATATRMIPVSGDDMEPLF